MPNAAPQVAHALGAPNAAAFDIGSACTGFLSALAAARAMLASGATTTALIIGAEIMSRHVDPADRNTAALFGDGAGAIVATAGAPGDLGPVVLGSDGGHANLIVADRDTQLLAMDGHETFKQAVRRLGEASIAAAQAAGIPLDRARPLRLPPGQHADPREPRRTARARPGEGRRRDRRGRQHLRRERAAGARAGAPRGAPTPGHAGAAGGRGLRLHLGRERGRVGEGVSATRPEGACALVTGGSRGIGAAIALALAEDGWPVAINYLTGAAGANSLVAEIDSRGGRAAAIEGDVADPETPARLIEAAEQALEGPVLALVNNAGVRADGLAMTLSDEDWRLVLDTNLGSTYRLTRTALRAMIRARFGRVINIASVVGPRANAGQANYAASKAAVIGFTKTAAVEVARRGVTINAVAPGLIATAMTDDIPQEFRDRVPAQRPGTPEEVAAAVAFLASDRAGYITGSTLYVDGGLSA